MKRKTSSCTATPAQMGDPLPELPEQIQKDLNAMGGMEALAECIPPQSGLEEMSRIHHALADPLRLTILYLVRDQPLCVCVINRFMRLSGSKLSYHLNILKESGMVEGEYHGNWIIYTITDRGNQALKCTEDLGRE
jgi:ArsR family transcriptional regulator, arsenate/arsenite/antimonite-responsive transcriptional repressor